MTIDPELKAMSEVFGALNSLDEATQKRIVEWVFAKLQSQSTSLSTKVKRGPKLGRKRSKRGRKPGSKNAVRVTGAKRGPKPGSKRGPKPGSKRSAKPGKRGRPRKNSIPKLL